MSYEQLIALRETIFKTINNLEMNLLSEKKKADECDFFRNDKNFDMEAMDAQAKRSLENVKEIKKVLDEEYVKLNNITDQISKLSGILNDHKSYPCLIGIAPHSWNILARHNSGKFAHRKCTICQTDEKVGYS